MSEEFVGWLDDEWNVVLDQSQLIVRCRDCAYYDDERGGLDAWGPKCWRDPEHRGTATKNAFCAATLRDEEGFTRFDIVHETYVLQYHGVDDRDDYLRYLLSHGCTIAAIHDNTDIPRRTISDMSKRLNAKEN